MSNVYDFEQARADYNQTAALNTTQEVTPDDAARAFDLSKVTSVPASIIAANKDRFEQDFGSHYAGTLIQNNPIIADFLHSHELHAPLVKDDLANLDRLSNSYRALAAKNFAQEGFNTFKRSVWDPLAAFGKGYASQPLLPESQLSPGGTYTVPKPETPEDIEFAKNHPNLYSLLAPVVGLPGLAQRQYAGIMEGLHQAGVAYLKNFVSDQHAESLTREALGVLESEMVGMRGHPPVVGEVPLRGEVLPPEAKPPEPPGLPKPPPTIEGIPSEEAVQQFQQGLAEAVGKEVQTVKPWADAGQEPPLGVSPATDAIKEAQVKIDQDLIKNALDDANKTELRERSPDKFREFLRLHPTGNLTIDKEAILQDPGRWDWIPELEKRLSQPGYTVDIPAADFLTNFDKADWSAVKDFVAREGNLSANRIQVYHGSPADFTAFDSAFNKTGEGANVILPGHYVAENPEVAGEYQQSVGARGLPQEQAAAAVALRDMSREEAIAWYRQKEESLKAEGRMSNKYISDEYSRVRQLLESGWEPPKGNLYTARILQPKEAFLDWDKPWAEQAPEIQALYKGPQLPERGEGFAPRSTGDMLDLIGHELLNERFKKGLPTEANGPELTANVLKEMGIPGVKYLDQGSREGGKGTHNYVVFNDKDLEITHKNGVPISKGEGETLKREAFARSRSLSPTVIRRGRTQGRPIATKPLGDTERLLYGIQQSLGLIPPGHPPGPITSGKTIGITQKELERLYDLIEKQTTGNADWVKKRAEAQAKLESSIRWKVEAAHLEPVLRADIENRPLVAAWRRLGKVKLDTMHLTPAEKADIPDLVGPEGLHPDQAASEFGYATGDDLIRALREMAGEAARGKGDIVDRLVKQELKELLQIKLGKTPEEMLESAIDHTLSLTTMEMLHENLMAAGSRVGKIPDNRDTMQWAAAQVLLERPYQGTTSVRLGTEAMRAARNVQKAEAAGDHLTVFQELQQQFLLMAMTRVMREIEKEKKEFARYAKGFRQRERANFPIENTNFIQDILMRSGQRVDRAPEDLARAIEASGYKDLDDFVNHLEKAQGWEVPVRAELRDPSFKQDVKDMNLGEFRATNYSIRTLVHRGQESYKIRKAGEAIDLADLVDQGTEFLRTLPVIEVPGSVKPGLISKISRGSAQFMWGLVTTERIINRWDQFNPRGILTRWLIHPMADASNYEAKLFRETQKTYRSLPAIPEPFKSIPNNLFMDPRLRKEGKLVALKMTKSDAIGVLANMGNKSNATKLALGWHIVDAKGEPDFPRIWKWLQDNLRKEDFDRQQAFGDKIANHLKDLADRNAEAESDVPAENVPLEGISIQLRDQDGKVHDLKYKGWYHKLIPHEVFEGGGKFTLETNDYVRAATPRSFEKQRTGAVYPLSFDFSRIEATISEMIHDIAFRGPVRQFAKALNDDRFRNLWQTHYPKETLEGAETWLRSVSNGVGGQGPYMKLLTDAINHVRRATMGSLINLNLGTPQKHGPTAAFYSAIEVGPINLARAFGNLYLNPYIGKANRDFLDKYADELHKRGPMWQYVVGGKEQAMTQKESPVEWWNRVGSWMVQLSDAATTGATWLAAFENAFREHGDFELARQEAHAAVRHAHGSSSPTYRPPIMSAPLFDNPLAQQYFSFYTIFNAMFQYSYEAGARTRDGWRAWKDGEWVKGFNQFKKVIPIVVSWAFVYLVEEEVRKNMTGDEKDKSPWWAWGPLGLATQIPFVRDLMHGIAEGYDTVPGLFVSTFRAMGKMYKETLKAGAELQAYGGLSDEEIANLLEAYPAGIGAITGRGPGVSGGHAMAGMYRWAKGQEDPTDFWSFFRLLARGHTDPLHAKRR